MQTTSDSSRHTEEERDGLLRVSKATVSWGAIGTLVDVNGQ